jgi:hypothetical protein
MNALEEWPNDVRALDPEAAHQRAAVLRLLREADRIGQAVAARVAAAVVAEHAVAAGESALSISGPKKSAQTPAWMSTTSSPVPRISYSSSIPSIGARSIASLLVASSAR